MKATQRHPKRAVQAFTLTELLVVISIIAILAGLVLPAVVTSKKTAQIKQAKIEEAQIVQAIQSYYSTYSRYPVTKDIMTSRTDASPDFTYGATFRSAFGIANFIPNPTNSVDFLRTNDLVIAVLMDMEFYPSNPTWSTVNKDHAMNPQQIKFLDARIAPRPELPGVGPDLVYRDPWGRPYLISLDLNYDDRTLDWFYRNHAVSRVSDSSSSGLNGLFVPPPGRPQDDNYTFSGGVMVWSLGPDGDYDLKSKANQGLNQDNVLSWKP